ncbi:MAG: DUF4411 family protein [Planctomycetes bacterium]|nr:DUF4411 family protein [Planctomycetota bacterium]
MSSEIGKKKLAIPKIAFDEEVAIISPDCSTWLNDNNIEKLPMTPDIIGESVGIKNILGIVNDNYHSKGVGEIDIFIIATAKIHKIELVSNENRQSKLPDILSKYKIPAVCKFAKINVSCIDFTEFIKATGRVF